MLFREFQPGPAACEIVERLWVLETEPGAPLQRIVPDGRFELIVNLGAPFESVRDGEWRPQPRAFVAGQITGP